MKPEPEPELTTDCPQDKFGVFDAAGNLDREMLHLAAMHYHQEQNKRDMETALELTAAGWTAEIAANHTPHPFTGMVDVMSWYWRAPSKREGKKGRRYLSTGQAYSAFKKTPTRPQP